MMKTIRMNVALASMMGAATLLLAPVAMSEWDAFHSGQAEFYTGERELPGSYRMTAATGTEGQGFDVFHVGDGVKVDDFSKAYIGTSLGSEASDGWDVFRVGEGDPLP
jgi:hypothetical protein